VKTLADCTVAIQQEGTYLIDNAGALTDQPLTHPVQSLQVELIDGLCGNDETKVPTGCRISPIPSTLRKDRTRCRRRGAFKLRNA
jgi:hypothetical protein